MRVDAACRPAGDSAVFAYWRMLEKGGQIEPLLAIERPVYGVIRQTVVRLAPDSGRVEATLGALPGRTLVVETGSRAGLCQALATTRVSGEPAELLGVHANVRWPFGVESILLTGRAADGRMLRETVRP